MSNVLVVEDNPEIQELYSTALGNEYDLIQVYDVDEALKALENNKVDLIILDIILPLKDGHHFLVDIHDTRHKNIPVIVSTILSKRSEPVRIARRFSDIVYIKKPFDPAELRLKIKKRLLEYERKRKGLLRYMQSSSFVI